MKIKASFLNDPALGKLLEALTDAGHQALIVGGAVRNAVLGQSVDDVDISTDALPEQVVRLAHAAGMKTVPTGIEHGTVTVIADGTPFEITTFRRDVETDGRNATVAFSDRIEDDAARRDFTMNALYATVSGEVLDPVGGWADLRRRELRFVGDPTARIREDYLRILRFFRFLAWYAHKTAPGTVEAITAEKAGLSRVSAERIGAEMRKLLAAPDPAMSMGLMQETGVLSQILDDADTAPLAALVAEEKERNIAPDWLRRLSLIAPETGADRLRLSRVEIGRLESLRRAAGLPPTEASFRHGPDIARDAGLIRLARGDALPPDWLDQIDQAAHTPLPVSASDLMPDLTGPALGRGLKAAENLWIASTFSASKAALIDAARQAGEEDA
ncbi:CCA tRNA nucleotidyltransferase [Paracoccus aurantiacus]|uniref:CCA tRNA nucleotidyltransferase n=1 Tax=Paracoccus aurantiacus TaxID=2599412 RepID=A0A5C6S293_9RHOB|nr:CCA tRNA nucleotidyltransferase [Paracoccus aurantiacus]TXB68049.1 CCA tRNA nucleotidyltransferase [Paracoccus aurantiacus]